MTETILNKKLSTGSDPDKFMDLDRVDHVDKSAVVEHYRSILEALGEDAKRPGLIDTPERVAKAMIEFTKGSTETVEQVVGDAVYDSGTDEIVVLKGIEFYSLCEHHLLPFFGTISIGYQPKGGRVIGLSKLVRIVEVFSRRLQEQERLTVEIAEAVEDAVEAAGVGVVVEAQHMCMVMRGVNQSRAVTVTRSWRGCAREAKKEFLLAMK